ncbi:MAG: hypothetical protein RIR70_2010, partial [Pseudomonadota bacterium]
MEQKSSSEPRPRVLVVHESRIMRASVTRHIKHRYDCLEAIDLESGWKMLSDDPGIEVVITDLSLPQEEGVQFVSRVLASDVARVAATPVLLMVSEDGHAANEIEEARQRALAAGAVDFVSKATSGVEMLARIASALNIARLRAGLLAHDALSALHLPIDPSSGLMTQEYLEVAGQQVFSSAYRNQTELTALAIAIDGLPVIDARFGVVLGPVISREISVLMARCLRREDILACVDTGRFMALLPGIAIADLVEVVATMQARLAATVMRYQSEIVQVTVSVGAASCLADLPRDVKQLKEIAQRRLIEAMAGGVGQYVGPEPLPATTLDVAMDDDSIDQALKLLQDKN